MTDTILKTLAEFMECTPEQVKEALETCNADVTLEQLLWFHAKLSDIIVRDILAEVGK